MNSFVTFACLLAVAGVSHASYGINPIIPVYAPAAVSTQNLYKAPPIPIVKTILSPVISAPLIKTIPISVPLIKSVPIISPLGLGLNGLGINELGLINGLGLKGLGGYGYGLNGYGYGLNGYGLNGYGYGKYH